MVIALVITVLYVAVFWLVFFRLKLLTFSITWAVVSSVLLAHVLLVFVIGLHFMTPYTTNAKVVQYTIQLIPRLPEPTLVTAVLVEPNLPVKKGQPLFQFDWRPYENKVKEQEAALAAARQDVLILKNDVETARAVLAKATAELRRRDTEGDSHCEPRCRPAGARASDERPRFRRHSIRTLWKAETRGRRGRRSVSEVGVRPSEQ